MQWALHVQGPTLATVQVPATAQRALHAQGLTLATVQWALHAMNGPGAETGRCVGRLVPQQRSGEPVAD